MLIYSLIFLYLVFMFWLVNYRKIGNKRVLAIPTFIFLFLIVGFRHFTVGSDSISYKVIFENNLEIPPLSEYFSSRFELGFLFLNKVIYENITTNYSIYFAIYSFITLAITFFVVKKESKDFYMSLIVYYAIGIYTASMNTLRVSFAMAFIYLAYYFIKRNKNTRAIVSIVVASSFHISALVFIFVYFLRKIRIKNVQLMLVAFVVAISYFFIKDTLEIFFRFIPKYEVYLDSTWYNDSGKLGTILGFVTILSVFLFGEYVFRDTKLNKNENFLRNIMIIATVAGFLSIQTALLARFTVYFNNFIILYVPLIISKIKAKSFVDQKRKALMVMTIITLLGLRFFIVLIFKPEWNIIVPYRNTLIDLLLGR